MSKQIITTAEIASTIFSSLVGKHDSQSTVKFVVNQIAVGMAERLGIVPAITTLDNVTGLMFGRTDSDGTLQSSTLSLVVVVDQWEEASLFIGFQWNGGKVHALAIYGEEYKLFSKEE